MSIIGCHSFDKAELKRMDLCLSILNREKNGKKKGKNRLDRFLVYRELIWSKIRSIRKFKIEKVIK